jgi:translin
MTDIEELRRSLSGTLDQEEEIRETAFKLSRDLIRSCRRVISDLVQGKKIDLKPLIAEKDDLLKAVEPKKGRFGFVEDALTEYAEAAILESILNGDGIPRPENIGINERAYILGACDTVGELRRVALNRLLSSDLDDALDVYESMKEIGHLIEGMVYPSGMIPLKKKQDVVRSLLDRTGGELAVALNSGRMNGGGGGRNA